MTENTMYGAQFLETLDQLAGKSVFRFAERKAFLAMNQDEVAKHMKSLGNDFVQQATDGTAQELAEFFASRIKAAADSRDDLLNLFSQISLLASD